MMMMNFPDRKHIIMGLRLETSKLNHGGCTSWWINLFKDLHDRGVFVDGNIYHTECLWFCFNEVIQHELDFIKLHWNAHYIRPPRDDTIPGKPDELFFLTECCGVEDQLHPVSGTQVDNIGPQYDLVNPTLDNDHQEYFKCL